MFIFIKTFTLKKSFRLYSEAPLLWNTLKGLMQKKEMKKTGVVIIEKTGK